MYDVAVLGLLGERGRLEVAGGLWPSDTMAPRPANPELVVRSLSGGITTFSAPFTRIVVPFGGRSPAVKL